MVVHSGVAMVTTSFFSLLILFTVCERQAMCIVDIGSLMPSMEISYVTFYERPTVDLSKEKKHRSLPDRTMCKLVVANARRL